MHDSLFDASAKPGPKGQALIESLIALPIVFGIVTLVLASLTYVFFEFQVAHFKNEYDICLRSQVSFRFCQIQKLNQIQSLSRALGLHTVVTPAQNAKDWILLTRWKGWEELLSPGRTVLHSEASP